MLHVAPESCFEEKFRKFIGQGYLAADLYNSKVMVKMDITDIHYPDQSFDFIYCSHVLEHVIEDTKAMAEFHRVLKPGGVFINLETSQPTNWIIRQLFHTYVGALVEYIGKLLSGHRTGYAYLSRSIRKFFNARDLARIIRQAGFKEVLVDTMFFGVAAIHMAYK